MLWSDKSCFRVVRINSWRGWYLLPVLQKPFREKKNSNNDLSNTNLAGASDRVEMSVPPLCPEKKLIKTHCTPLCWAIIYIYSLESVRPLKSCTSVSPSIYNGDSLFFPSLLNYTRISLQKLFAFRYFSMHAVLTLLHSAGLLYECPVLCSVMYNWSTTSIINQTFKIFRILLVFVID